MLVLLLELIFELPKYLMYLEYVTMISSFMKEISFCN